MSSTNFPEKDLSLTNLAVQNQIVAKSITTGTLNIGSVSTEFFLPETIPFTPSPSFALNANSSKRIGNIINISVQGDLTTASLASTNVFIGSIPLEFAPDTDVQFVSCDPSLFGGVVLVAKLQTNGDIVSCPTGTPYPVVPTTYNYSMNGTYVI